MIISTLTYWDKSGSAHVVGELCNIGECGNRHRKVVRYSAMMVTGNDWKDELAMSKAELAYGTKLNKIIAVQLCPDVFGIDFRLDSAREELNQFSHCMNPFRQVDQRTRADINVCLNLKQMVHDLSSQVISSE